MRTSEVTDVFAIPNLSVRKHTVGAASFNMVNLPGTDNFQMGNNKGEEDSGYDEQPRHLRNIAPFAFAQYPVTQAFWKVVVELAKGKGFKYKKKLLRPDPSYFRGAHRPVENLSWDDAQEFCRVLNVLSNKPKGYFRLPSEAEWEYAARAGERETWYAGSNEPGETVWCRKNNHKETMPVGQLAPNKFGLYDLSGNIWEWCEDDYRKNYKKHHRDGQAWRKNRNRDFNQVLRGGSWEDEADECRCGCRDWLRSEGRGRDDGFRLAAPV